jgi:ribonuclease P protein component
MLPINRRVKKELFPEIMKTGIFSHGNSFYIKYLDQKNDKPSLFSFVIPAKIVKTSVKRHKLKRKMTAVVEKHLKTIRNGFWVLVFAKKDVSGASYVEIEKEILDLLSKVSYNR